VPALGPFELLTLLAVAVLIVVLLAWSALRRIL